MAKAQPVESHPVLKNFVPYKIKRGEAYMNENQREHFKQILQDWREQLMQEVDRTVHHLQDDAANYLTRLTGQPRKKNSVWSCGPETESASSSKKSTIP